MKSIKLILFSCSLLIVFNSNAQFGQFWNTRTQKNPAFQVLNHSHFANVTHRNIWPSLSSSRVSNTASYGLFLDELKGGLGFYFNNETWTNAFQSNSIKLAYNYQKQLGRQLRISVGTGVGAIFSKHDDLIFPQQYEYTQGTAFGLDIGTAIFWRKLEAGVGIKNVLKTNDVARDLSGEKRWNLNAQYIFGKESGFQFFPQLQIETDFTHDLTMINGKIGYKNRYFLAAGIVLNNTILYSGQVFLWERLRVIYSYQQTINSIQSINAASHEIGMNLEIKRKPRPRRTSGGVSF